MKYFLKFLSSKDKTILKKFLSENKKLRNFIAYFFSYSLTNLARIYKTDKWGKHSYTLHYQKYLCKYKYKRINLLEIGVGGDENPNLGGNSLRMWKKYFPFGNIFSIDIYDKHPQEERRIKIFKGSQSDLEFLNFVCDSIGDIDIIIDDGSHINEHVITSFEFLFPKLKKGGIYVIEDTQTSYWESFGGSSNNLNKKGTIYYYFKSLLDCLNSDEIKRYNYQKNYYDEHLHSIHFYHNLIFIFKN